MPLSIALPFYSIGWGAMATTPNTIFVFSYSFVFILNISDNDGIGSACVSVTKDGEFCSTIALGRYPIHHLSLPPASPCLINQWVGHSSNSFAEALDL
ncbi:hypothetical protein F5Y18DRAFT_284637 [Xylariaceae sp. FL1019]|nr:hypothetical protein F5Y18DRAFT_284637 [Xylariaceae sp. FL1019]